MNENFYRKKNFYNGMTITWYILQYTVINNKNKDKKKGKRKNTI